MVTRQGSCSLREVNEQKSEGDDFKNGRYEL